MKRIHVSTILLFFAALFLFSCTKEEIINNKVPVAIAGDSLTVELSQEDFIVLTGSGKDADGEIVAYLWSQVSGPDKAVILSEGAAETKVANLVSGTYVFQLMVIDNDGATGVDNIVVIVKNKIVELTLQPANNPDEVHTSGYISGSDITDHNSPELAALSWTINSNPILSRGYFKFDLSSIPATATIVSAKLSLYSMPQPRNGNLSTANAGTNNTTLISRVTNAWTAGNTNWHSQPPVSDLNQIVIPHTNSGFFDLVDIDVLKLVENMIGTNANHGFQIRLQTETNYNSRIFCSSKHSDHTKHPRLEVVYK